MSDTARSGLGRGAWRWFLAMTVAAFAVRLLFVLRFPAITPDSYVYGDLAKNWLLQGVYGLSAAGGPAPTYIRLPGYPAFLGAVWAIAGVEHYNAVRFAQMLFDLATCLVTADLARRVASPAAESSESVARTAFALAALCPFLANYTAAPLTETLAIFFTVVALDFAAAALARDDDGGNGWRQWAGSGLGVSACIYLRPDGGMLLMALGAYLLYRLLRRNKASVARAFDRGPRVRDPRQTVRSTLRAGVVLAACALAPLAPWAVRNWRVFHQFQPLAPLAANAPGEFVARGFDRWMRTWLVDYASLEDIGFRVDGEPISVETLPSRAFDTPEERSRTEELFALYNQELAVTPALDAQFADLARQRIRRKPVRYYLELPLARAADLWLRPRSELLPLDSHWWKLREDPHDFAWSLLLAAVNLVYVGLAIRGLRRWRDLCYAGMLTAFVVLRTALITLLAFPEPRYVLECYPAAIVLAAAALSSRSFRKSATPAASR